MCRQGKSINLYKEMAKKLDSEKQIMLMSLSDDEASITQKFKEIQELDVIVKKQQESIFLISLKTVDNEKQKKQ